MPFQDVLDLLIKADSRYYWVFSDGVVVVRPLAAWKKPDHFLHDTLQSVELKEQNIGAALDQITVRPGTNLAGGEEIMANDPELMTLSIGPVRWEVKYCLPELESDVATVWFFTYDDRGLGRPGPFAREKNSRTVNRCHPPK